MLSPVAGTTVSVEFGLSVREGLVLYLSLASFNYVTPFPYFRALLDND